MRGAIVSGYEMSAKDCLRLYAIITLKDLRLRNVYSYIVQYFDNIILA